MKRGKKLNFFQVNLSNCQKKKKKKEEEEDNCVNLSLKKI